MARTTSVPADRSNRKSGSGSNRRAHKRCLNCSCQKGKRSCFGYPLCKRCRSLPANTIDSLDGHFVDWQRRGLVCNDYWREFSTFWTAVISTERATMVSENTQRSSNTIAPRFSVGNVILDLAFIDRVLLDHSNHHTVVPTPLQPESLHLNSTERAPCIDLDQMDQFVKDEVWGQALWDSLRGSPHEQEEYLWSRVKLFLGYLSLKLNMSTTYVRPLDSTTTRMGKAIAAELVYLTDFRLQMLWFELCSQLNNFVLTPEYKQNPSLTLFALEVLYLLTSSMRSRDRQDLSQPRDERSTALQQSFNKQIDRILSCILEFECLVSGRTQVRHQTKKVPEIVKFARAKEVMAFPSHCVVTAHLHSSVLPCPTSSSWDQTSRFCIPDILGGQFVDALGCTEAVEEEQPSSSVNSSDEEEQPASWIDSSNKICTRKEIFEASQTHNRPEGTDRHGSISDQCSSITVKANDNVDNLSDASMDDVPGQCESTNDSDIVMVSSDDSPYSAFSPPTPDSSMATTFPGFVYQLPSSLGDPEPLAQ